MKLINRVQKLQFLKNLRAGRASIQDIVEPKHEIRVLLDYEDDSGNVYDETKEVFTKQRIEIWNKEVNHLYI